MISPEDARRNARLLFTADQVDAAMRTMAGEIAGDLARCRPVIVAVMNGGAFTAVNLCRHFDFAYEFDYVHATRYGDSLTGGLLEWRSGPQPSLSGRTVLLVDDVLDKGITLQALHEELAGLGVERIATAVLVTKRISDNAQRPAVDYYAFETDDVYLFGCGMDYAGYWRGLPELYALHAQ